MSESKQSFTVKDRRHFTTDGERKEAVEDAPAAEAAPELAATPGTSQGTERPGVDFVSFVVSLAAQASALLAPSEGQRDLDGARHVIGILEMLKEKTQGRRSPEEDGVLDELLYQLRMAYVEVSKRSQP